MTVDSWYLRPSEERVASLTLLATNALRAWGVADARPELFLEGENAVFKLPTEEYGLCAVRVHRADYHTPDHLQSQVEWCRALTRDRIVRTADVIDTLDGDAFIEEAHPDVPEPRFVSVLRWEPGRSLGDAGLASAATFGMLGSLMAKVHEHGRTWPGRANFTGLRWDASAFLGESPVLGPFWNTRFLDAEDRDVMSAFRGVAQDALQDFGVDESRFGLVHGDFLPQNLLLHNDEITVLDFDDCGHGWYVMEIATALMRASFTENYEQIREALVTEYRRHRRLDDGELKMLPLLVALRTASYVGWVETRAYTSAARERGPAITRAGVNAAKRYLDGTAP